MSDGTSVRAGAALAAVGGGIIAVAGAVEIVTTSYLLGVGVPPDGAFLLGTAGTALVLGTTGLVLGVGMIALAFAALYSPSPRPIGTGLLVLAVGSLMVAFGGLVLGLLLGFAGGWMIRRVGRPGTSSTDTS